MLDLGKRLKNCPTSVAELARRSGISRPAILDIREGRTTNPHILTVQALEQVLDEVDRERPADSPVEARP